MNFKRYITCIDTHTGGEPTRVITAGFPAIPGKTLLEKSKYVMDHYDSIRKMVLLEPRGHSAMYGCIMVPPVTDDGHFGVLFAHSGGMSSMCGHATVGVTTVAIETGMVPSCEGENIVRIDTPAGRITAYADVKNERVRRVRFQNVPCFVYRENITVPLEGIGDVTADIVYCGAFFVYVDAARLGLKVLPEHTQRLVDCAMKISEKTTDNYETVHPLDKDLNWIYGTIIMDPVERDGKLLKSRNICVVGERHVDRSPTGTGTGGRIALHMHRGVMKSDDLFINRSITNTSMEARFVMRAKVADYDAVVTEVGCSAYITGFNQLVLDPEDPLGEGFIL